MTEMTMDQFIKQLDENGWKEGYQRLRQLHEYLENQQAFLFAEPPSLNHAEKMSPRLAKQDVALKRIEIEANRRGIDIGEVHK